MDVSIIIVSYNVKDILLACLDSIYQHTKNINFEIIVVDNNSPDGSAAAIKKRFPKVKLIANRHNPGFGAANNQGAQKAKGKYLLFLNPDTLFIEDSLSICLPLIQNNPQLGVFSCRLLNRDHSIQPTGGYFPNLARIFAWHTALDEVPLLNRFIKPIHPSASFYQNRFSLDWVTGAFMLIPKQIFKQVGGFDEAIFMYGEELELCYRIKQAGYQVIYDPATAIIHLGGQSAGSQMPLISEITGLKYFFSKHHPAWQRPLVSSAFFLGSLLRLLLFGIIMGDASKKRAYQKALKA